MLDKSNSRREAQKANERGAIISCPYSQDSEVTRQSLAMIDEVGERMIKVLEGIDGNEDEKKRELDIHKLEKSGYILNHVTMHGLFIPAHFLLFEKQKEIIDYISQQCSLIQISNEQLPEFIKLTACRYIAFLLMQHLHGQVSKMKIQDVKRERLYRNFQPCLESVIHDFKAISGNHLSYMMEISQPDNQTKLFTLALSLFFSKDPNIINHPDRMEKLLGYLLCVSHDKERAFLDEYIFHTEDPTVFINKAQDIVGELNFCGTIDILSVAFASTYGIVCGIAKSFTKQEGFHELDTEEKRTMFFSIKQDLLSQAMYWSKKFVKANRGGSSLINPPKGSSELDEKTLVFNFEGKKIFVDGTKQLEAPQEPGHVHRSCLASHVKSEGISGSLTSHQVDMALKLYWENYLSKI